MDLSTIKKKLDNGDYKDPWEYCDDVRLMFHNAWLYNKKSTRVYKSCTALSELWEKGIDKAMQRLQFCCGKRQYFTPSVLYCSGPNIVSGVCAINRDQKYMTLETGVQNPIHYCLKCWKDFSGQEKITLPADWQSQEVAKKDFVEKTNGEKDPEPFVECAVCGRKNHEICVLWHKDCGRPFVCDKCKKNHKKNENQFTAKKLAKTKLGDFLERRIRKMIKEKGVSDCGEVTVRVVSVRQKVCESKPKVVEYYTESGAAKFPKAFPYRCKALLLFQKQGDADVCFFCMHVQEYDHSCPPPNQRRVYIGYLDSVHFFQPRALRTPVYHELLIGYLDYCRTLGYVYAHIWACPPSPGDDYIFHCHPSDQQTPTAKKLQQWSVCR